ncbi:MAG: FHA domain-containing protein [Burkholderiaceae bacterium]
MNLKKMLFPSESDKPAGLAQPTCAAGHALDPSWGGVCPYCESAARARTKTAPISSLEMPQTSSGTGRETRIADEPVPSSRRETMVDSNGTPGSQKQPPDGRRITGILASFTWKPTGEVFLLREGKNTIGAGNISDEGHKACDVQIRVDPEMSKEHALILCRQGRYELADLNSSNGTFLEGQMIPSHAVELKNDARIKVGSTVLQFLKIEGGRAAGVGPELTVEMTNEDDEDPAARRRGPDLPGRLTSIE